MRQDDVTRERDETEAIRAARTADDFALARSLFVEYAQWLKVDLCFQDFERELAELPGAYAAPRGRLLLAGSPGQAFGCVALRPLAAACGCGPGAGGAEGVGEVKRLYVKPSRRGQGWGARLAGAVVAEARVVGYRELKLDTLAWMAEARALYTRLGFRECAPYYANPLDGVMYMSLLLSPPAEKAA